MNEMEIIAKKWGSSLAVVIPKEIVEKEKIKEGESIHITIDKHSNLSDVFGTLKTKVPGQKFKDMCREGWD